MQKPSNQLYSLSDSLSISLGNNVLFTNFFIFINHHFPLTSNFLDHISRKLNVCITLISYNTSQIFSHDSPSKYYTIYMSVNNSFYSVLNVGLMGFLNENIDGATLESLIIQYNLSLAYDEHVNEENLMSLNNSQISSLFTELFNYIPHYFAYKEISTLRDSSIKSIFQKISFVEELFAYAILLKNSWDHDHSTYMEFISDIILKFRILTLQSNLMTSNSS